MTDRVRRVLLGLLCAGAGTLIVACSGGPNDPSAFAPTPTLVIEPGVTESTQIAGGSASSFAASQREGPAIPFVEFQLTVPDGSPVLQYRAPRADFVIVSENSRQEIVAKPCQLSVGQGVRSFWAQHRITAEQYNTLQSVIVSRVYE